MPRPRVGVAAALAALALTACGCADPAVPASEPNPPFDTCPVAVASPAQASGPSRTLPDVTLPCFRDGAPVALAGLGRPAVINFWASSCAPCRKELPEFQRFADMTEDDVVVVGVVTADSRPAAAALARDLGVSFPAVFDPDSRLLRALGRNVLPVTVFVDASGTVVHEDVSGALTLAELSRLARQHLGVDVP